MRELFINLTWPQAIVLTAGFISLGGLILAAGEIGAAAIGRNRTITWYRGRYER